MAFEPTVTVVKLRRAMNGKKSRMTLTALTAGTAWTVLKAQTAWTVGPSNTLVLSTIRRIRIVQHLHVYTYVLYVPSKIFPRAEVACDCPYAILAL